ncbi:MAG: SUMF1/EgtB/PvdO family nonheme iron enzyme [Gammaproteobacteria bacterium]|nr:SUMF1/EgtB/PvdO family nonheme iron enzyme [Gammaproteobacteria bacterium]
MHEDSLPFAEVSLTVLRHLGSGYRDLVEHLEKSIRQMKDESNAETSEKQPASQLDTLETRQQEETTENSGNEENHDFTPYRDRLKDGSEGPEMVYLPGGTFWMGSENGDDNEKPVHEVTLIPFSVGRYPVTVREFREFVEAAGCETEAERGGGALVFIRNKGDWNNRNNANWKNAYLQQEEDHPVVCVSWNDAIEYCKWISEETKESYTLLSEAQWEYACRAKTATTAYYFGDSSKDLSEYAWYGENSNQNTHPVGEKKANQFGLYDMHGNVSEWVNDWYGFYKNEPATDPAGPQTGEGRVDRGGTWASDPSGCRCSSRGTWEASLHMRNSRLGFRLARVGSPKISPEAETLTSEKADQPAQGLTEKPPNPLKSNFYALLAGINDYASPDVSSLNGCVNDVNIFADLLRKKFDVPEKGLKILINEQATHANIKAAFREHLTGTAKIWSEAGKNYPAPAFLFYFSGHGSQAVNPTGSNPDGMDSTIVPWDSRTDGVYDIKDWEINAMLDELASYGTDNVTVIMDCEFSNLRGNLQSNYVFLGACNKTERVREHDVGEGSFHHSAMTYFLVQELRAMSGNLTYRKLHQRITDQLNKHYSHQHSQCTGDINRLVFGNLHLKQDIFLTIIDKRDGYFWINGGLAHGITEGSELQVYPPETRTLEGAGKPLAMLQVEEEGATRSACVSTEGEQNIPRHARVAIHRLNFGNMQRSVLIEIDDAEVRDNLSAFLSDSKLEPYIHIVEQGDADFRVTLQDSTTLRVQDNSGADLLPPCRDARISNTAFEVSRDLLHLVRFQNTLELANSTPYSELADAISVEIKRLDFDPEPIAKFLENSEDGETVLESGQRIVVEITNHSDQPLYFTVLNLSSDFSVTRLYPRMRGSHEQLAPERTFSLGLSRKRNEQLTRNLPGGISESWEVIKVIATVDEADFELLELPALLIVTQA